jgi:hypothetical protein
MQQFNLHFDGNAVAAPAHRAAVESNEMIAFCLKAIEAEDLSGPPPRPAVLGNMHYSFSDIVRTADERRAFYVNWIVAKGLNELARSIRSSFEEALFYIEGLKIGPVKITVNELNDKLVAIKRRANGFNLPDLMREVNGGLTSPISFEGEIRSLQKVRNCLEHRGGIVSSADVDDTQILTLNLPRIKAYFMNGDAEIEVESGMHFEAETLIMFKRVTRTRAYSLGEPLTFSAADFNEMAFACILFGTDLASKLPIVASSEM